MKLRTSLVPLLLGFALAVGGCGDEDPSAEKPKLGTEQASWADAAGARCLEYQEAAVKVRDKYANTKLPVDEAIQASLRDGLPLLRDLVADLRALDVPDDVQGDWNTFVDGYQQITDEMPNFADEKAEGVETDEMRELFTVVGKKMQPVAEKYDVGACMSLATG